MKALCGGNFEGALSGLFVGIEYYLGNVGCIYIYKSHGIQNYENLSFSNGIVYYNVNSQQQSGILLHVIFVLVAGCQYNSKGVNHPVYLVDFLSPFVTVMYISATDRNPDPGESYNRFDRLQGRGVFKMQNNNTQFCTPPHL